MKLLDRYVIREMVGPFLFGVATFSILFFAAESLAGVARLIQDTERGGEVVGEYMLNRIPFTLIIAFPMSILLASLLTFGKLSGNSEITALKAGGVGFFRIALPALAFCAAITGLSWWLNEHVVPPTMKRQYDLLVEARGDEEFKRFLISEPRAYRNGEVQIVYMSVMDTESRVAEGVFIYYFWAKYLRRHVYADKARWNGQVWELTGVREVEYADNGGDPIYQIVAESGWRPMPREESPPGPDVLFQRELRPEEMSRSEIVAKLGEMRQVDSPNPEWRKNERRLEVAYHQKAALPFACLIFGTFALPLAMRPHRTGTSIGLGLSLVFILVYWVLLSIGQIFGWAGRMDPWLAGWLPNLFFGTLGVMLLLHESRK